MEDQEQGAQQSFIGTEVSMQLHVYPDYAQRFRAVLKMYFPSLSFHVASGKIIHSVKQTDKVLLYTQKLRAFVAPRQALAPSLSSPTAYASPLFKN